VAASRIKGITVEIDGDTTGLSKALSSVNKEMKSTQSQLKDVEKLLKLDPTNTELLSQKQKLLTEAVSETKEKLETLKTAAEQANTALANGEISQEQYDALQREIIETEEELKKLETQAEQSATALQKISATGEKLQSVGDSISTVGTKLLPVTAGVVALGTAAVTTAANFETAMSSVKALISSSSTDIEGDMEKLEEAARSAGETTKFSATEAAEAMSYMGLAGWSADEMCEGLSGILNLAAASEMDLATASDIVTDYLSAFGLTAADSEMFVDKMAYAMSNSNTSTEQLGEAYKNCAATSTQLGYGLDETTAALMVMADAGIKGGEAGTALSSIMTRLGNNTSGCTDLLAEYGIEVYDAEGNVNSLSNILSGMQDIWADLTDEEKANLAYVVAGKTAQSELMTVLGETTGSFQEYQEGLAGCSGTAEDMAAIMQDNLEGQLTILKSQLQELAISFGQMLLPVIKNVVGVIQNIVDWLNGLDDSTRQIILTVALVAAAIGPMLIVVGKVISAVGTIMTVIPKLVSAFNMVKNAFSALSAVMMANPIMIVVTLIAALVAAFIYLWNTNEEFRQFWIDLWENIKEAVTVAVEAISAFLSEAWETIKTAAQTAWTAISEFFASVWEAISTTVSNVVTSIQTFLQTAWKYNPDDYPDGADDNPDDIYYHLARYPDRDYDSGYSYPDIHHDCLEYDLHDYHHGADSHPDGHHHDMERDFFRDIDNREWDFFHDFYSVEHNLKYDIHGGKYHQVDCHEGLYSYLEWH